MTQPDPYAFLKGPEDDKAAPEAPSWTAAQASEAVQEAQAPGLGGDAGSSLAQMTVDRPARLPAEDLMDQLMAQQKAFAAQLATMQGKLDAAQRDAAAVRSITGPPAITTYARGIAAKLQSHADANPDLPSGHFAAAIETAKELASAAAAAADGNSQAHHALGGLVGTVERFLTRGHARKSGKALDFSAVLQELESVLDEAATLGKAA